MGKRAIGRIGGLTLALFVLQGVSLMQPAQAAGRVALQVLEPEQRQGVVHDVPVSVGLVFPKGELSEVPGGRLVDDLGNAVPFEAEATGWWNPERSQVKWLLLHFRASGDRQYFFEPGPVAPAPPGEPIAVRDGDAIVVSTGPLEVRLAPGTRLFDGVSLNGAPMLRGDGPEFTLVADDGAAQTPGALGDWTLDLEEATPYRATVKATGQYLLPDGSPLARLELRYQFFQGESFVRVYHTLTWMVQDPAVGASEISLRIQPDLGLLRTLIGLSDWGGETLDVEAPDGGVYAHQDDVEHFTVMAGQAEAHEGRHLGGWVAAEGANGRGVALIVREPWQMFPLAFDVSADGLAVELWPSRGKRMGFSLNDIMPDSFYFGKHWNRFKWIDDEAHFVHEYTTNPHFMHTAEGAARTHELVVHFYDRASERRPAQLNSLTQHPVAVRQDPADAMRVPFLGLDIGPADVEGYPEFERAIEQVGRMSVGRWADMHDYGLWRYGMMRWGATGVSYRWMDGHQYSLQVIPWLLYMRGGDRDWLEEAEATARFAMDVSTNHYNTGGKETGYQSNASGMPFPWHRHHLGKHTKAHFLAYYYHLTGYRRAKEVLDEVIAGAKAEALAVDLTQADPLTVRSWGRELYNVSQFWANAYEETWDPEIKDLAREWADLTVNREYNAELRAFRTPALYVYDGLIPQQLLWDDGTLKPTMLEQLAAAGYPELKDGGVCRVEDAIACGWAHDQTGDERFAQVGWDIARTLADVVPMHDWASSEAPRYPYHGHQFYRHFLMPILVGYSLGAREGMTEADPYAMRDTFVSLPPAGAGLVQGEIALRPRRDGDLAVRIVMVGRWETQCEEVQATVLDSDGAEVARLTLPETERPEVTDRHYPTDFHMTQQGEVVIPAARQGATYSLRLDCADTDGPMALVLADADLVHQIPEGVQVEFYNRAGQYHVGARVFTRTTADEVTVINTQGKPYCIRDAGTGEVLFRSKLDEPLKITHDLGADRAIQITSQGRVDGKRFEGLSPWLSPTREGWFDPDAQPQDE